MGNSVENGMCNSTHIIASKTAYLIGIYEQYFWDPGKENRVFYREIYEELDKNKHARIARNLSILRTHILKNWKKINNAMRYDNALQSPAGKAHYFSGGMKGGFLLLLCTVYDIIYTWIINIEERKQQFH